MNYRLRSFALIAAALCIASAARAGEETITLENGSGRELTVGRCVICHSLDYIQMNAGVLNRSGWEKTIRKMIDRFGAPVSDEEAQQILRYLQTHYSSGN